jgi:hypothetical protein
MNIRWLEAVSKEIPSDCLGCRAWAVLYLFVGPSTNDDRRSILIRVRVVDIPLQELHARGGDLNGDEPFIRDRIDQVVQTAEEVQVLAQAEISSEGFGSSYQSGLMF